MKIGIDARLWNETGVGRYTRNLILELQKIDSENNYIIFINPGDEEEVRFKLTSSNFEYKLADIHWHSIREQLHYPKVLNLEKLDLMHFPYFSVPIFYTRPYVLTIHDLILHHFQTGEASTLPSVIYKIKHKGYKFVVNQAAQRAQKIITVSEATKNELINTLGISSEKIIVTYEGIDEKLSLKKSGSQLEFQDKYFLHIGNLYPHKNIMRLLEAFRLVIDKYPNIKLIFVGKEDFFTTSVKKKVESLNFQQNIVFTGFLKDSELIVLYQNAIGVLIPSLMEGFGLPGLEAMQQKTLVMASDIPSLREIYSDAALYFNPRDTGSMSQCMFDVLEQKPEYYKKQIELGILVSSRFSWEKMAHQTLKIYMTSDLKDHRK